MMTSEGPYRWQPLVGGNGAVISESPWGPDDEIGRVNWITDESQREVLSRIVPGSSYDLAVSLFIGTPVEVRFGLLFGAVGAVRDCIQAAIEYADSRVQFGKPISAFQLTQKSLVDMSVSLGNAPLLALHLGRVKDQGRIRPDQISVGKLNNVREAITIARECRTILGATASPWSTHRGDTPTTWSPS
ncbi:hypothetical protein GCM10022232_64940 [Streptomyces plumbiresistens]|uniref:Acyl-CoA dehydrogenase/oxidase C-terminal domain-containing protein n=1 Tax=Streptomyces plumbiresistens TaxID=511811 RepID=A0ABP7SMB9_9ACTN